MKIAKSIMLALILSVGLSACGAFDSLKIWRADKPEPCPRVIVLKNASQVTKFKEGPGRDLIDVLFEAKVSNVLSLCKYDVDYDTRAGLISAQLAPVFEAQRGPADTSRSATVEYFVAVVDADRKIVQKNTFPFKMAFPNNNTHVEVRDEPVDLAIVTDGNTDGRDYEIYVGFQLTREEAAYNQRISER